jgi:hypothetical protein
MHADLRQENSTLVALQRLEALDVQRRVEDQARTAQYEQTASILIAARNRNTMLFGLATVSSVLLVSALLMLGWQYQHNSNQVASILDGFAQKRRTLEREHATAVADLQQALQAARTEVEPLPVAAAPAIAPEGKRPSVQPAGTVQPVRGNTGQTEGVLPGAITIPTFSRDPLDGLTDGEETRTSGKQRSRRRGRH